jgi:hypothetical protein
MKNAVVPEQDDGRSRVVPPEFTLVFASASTAL